MEDALAQVSISPKCSVTTVLILVVMEDALALINDINTEIIVNVLILVVMEDALARLRNCLNLMNTGAS